MLRSLFFADGIIAINKPFGVGVRNIVAEQEEKISRLEKQAKEVPNKLLSHASSQYHTRGIGSCDYTLEDVLPILKSDLDLPNLELLKSTEK